MDAGALRAAVACGLEACGWMPCDECDEYGIIPGDIRKHLTRHSGGLTARTIANAEDADAVICIVPDATQGIRTPGTHETWWLARQSETPVIVIDGSDAQLARLGPWLHDLSEFTSTDGAFDLMIAGPRASLWPEGEETARRVVQLIAAIVTDRVDTAASGGHRRSST